VIFARVSSGSGPNPNNRASERSSTQQGGGRGTGQGRGGAGRGGGGGGRGGSRSGRAGIGLRRLAGIDTLPSGFTFGVELELVFPASVALTDVQERLAGVTFGGQPWRCAGTNTV
jgi:hypothetical protein